MRCGFCHNAEFVLPEKIKKISTSFFGENEVCNFLRKRKNLLEGVVISGGEPTLMPGLEDFAKKVKDQGFAVKLDTNGSRPEVLAKLIGKNLVDYIAMDVKTSLDEYADVVGSMTKQRKIAESIKMVKASGVQYEFRTTLIKELHPQEVLEKMAKMIRGAQKYYLQTFRNAQTLSACYNQYNAFSKNELISIKNLFSKYVKEVHIR